MGAELPDRGDAREDRIGADDAAALPFDRSRLDRRMAEHGIDLVLATSKHNLLYLLGGYRCLFFDRMDAIGVSRYTPFLGYPRGRPDLAFFVGNPHDVTQQAVTPIWAPSSHNSTWTSEAAAAVVAGIIRDLGLSRATVAIELPFLPTDSYLTLTRLLPEATVVDAVTLLEDARAVKQPHELRLLKDASERIVASMLAVFHAANPGMTTRQVAALLEQEELARGLAFDYCLVSTGANLNRVPSEARWERGASLSLDSGGNALGYIGDLARMAVMGRPSAEQEDLLREIDEVQMAAREPIRTGAPGRAIYDRALAVLARCPHRDQIDFLAHGMGLVSHEAPRLTSGGPVPYRGDHAERPLESGMVISIETTLASPRFGYIKLEDTVAVTETGWDAYGDAARGWQIVE